MIQTPHLNPNGTTPKELLKQQMDVMSALIIAIEKLRQAGPNGRDYQLRRPARSARRRPSMPPASTTLRS